MFLDKFLTLSSLLRVIRLMPKGAWNDSFFSSVVDSQWNEVTKLFRAGMPLRKHRLHFRVHGSCFTAAAAVDWLHELLRNNSNFGPDVTRQQTLQLLKKFLKNHVIEDVKGRWGTEELEDDGHIYRWVLPAVVVRI